MEEQIVKTWGMNSRMVLFLLDALTPEMLADSPPGKGKSVGDHFVHIHNVRLMWLKASAPNLAQVDKAEADDKDQLRTALTASGTQMGALLQQSFASGGKIKGFKPHAIAFLGYLISHESYHLGKIDFILRQAGHAVDDKTHYGLWDWDKL